MIYKCIFFSIINFTVNVPLGMGMENIFSRGWPLVDFSKWFSTGGEKWWNLIFPTRNKENNFLLIFIKSRGAWPLLPFRCLCSWGACTPGWEPLIYRFWSRARWSGPQNPKTIPFMTSLTKKQKIFFSADSKTWRVFTRFKQLSSTIAWWVMVLLRHAEN